PIRLAEPRETEVVAAVRRAAILALAPDRLDPAEAAIWARKPGRTEQIAAAIARRQIWVAERDGAIVGVAEVEADYVAGMYVAPEHAARGLGSRLLEWAEQRMREAGQTRARLGASANAVEFYRKRGWRQSGPAEGRRGTPMEKDLLDA